MQVGDWIFFADGDLHPLLVHAVVHQPDQGYFFLQRFEQALNFLDVVEFLHDEGLAIHIQLAFLGQIEGLSAQAHRLGQQLIVFLMALREALQYLLPDVVERFGFKLTVQGRAD